MMQEGDRVVWIGDEERRARGSSGKLESIGGTGETARVNWGDGDVSISSVGDLLTPREAAEVGIEPWASAYR